MLRSYSDIISRLGTPLWYDEHGTPRYDDFHPNMMGVYARMVILARIACQDCKMEFIVADQFSMTDFMQLMLRRHDLTIEEFAKGFHYGDPPRHDPPDGSRCAGETMNCDDLELLEVWEWSPPNTNFMDWTRHPELEGVVEDG